MKAVANLGIGTRLGLCFAFVLLIVACQTLVSIRTIDSARDELTRINDVQSVKQRYAINFRGSVHDRAIAIRDVVLLDDPAERAAQVALIDELAQFYYDSEARLDAMLQTPATAIPADIEIDGRIDAIKDQTEPLVAEIISLVDAGNVDRAHDLLMTQA